MKLGAELRHMDTTTAAVKYTVVTVAKAEEQDRAKEDYESLDRLIDSITRDFSRKGINSSLKALARKTGSNASLAKKRRRVIVIIDRRHHHSTSSQENDFNNLDYYLP